MKIKFKQAKIGSEPCAALVIGVWAHAKKLSIPENGKLPKICNEFLASNDFKGKTAEIALLYEVEKLPAKRIVLVGLGEKEGYNCERIRLACGAATKNLMRLGVAQFALSAASFLEENLDLSDVCQAAAEGIILASYQFTAYKEVPTDQKSTLDEAVFVFEGKVGKKVEEGVRWGKFVAEAANFARDLQNHPGNYLTPGRLAAAAKAMAMANGLDCKILEKQQMEKLNMGALLGVAKGSQEPPKFIILEHKPSKGKLATVVLVGKGITFDSGGISIKPSDRMEEMKFDMSGGAAVIGTMRAVAQLGMPLHVVGLIPACENLPSGTSMKPGDILRASSGTTVEIVNTDAEGRLILADALHYARRYKPAAVIDLATLTGACVVALGNYASGLFSRDKELAEALKIAGEKSGERVWQLPLWDDYNEDIKSDYADIKNSAGRAGGAITAAAFLGKFTQGYPWAHLDIAGTAWTDQEKGYLSKGGTGVGVRLLVEFLRGR
ncbi:MAG TPA: leucyl aminopeptidase [bacterium]